MAEACPQTIMPRRVKKLWLRPVHKHVGRGCPHLALCAFGSRVCLADLTFAVVWVLTALGLAFLAWALLVDVTCLDVFRALLFMAFLVVFVAVSGLSTSQPLCCQRATTVPP